MEKLDRPRAALSELTIEEMAFINGGEDNGDPHHNWIKNVIDAIEEILHDK